MDSLGQKNGTKRYPETDRVPLIQQFYIASRPFFVLHGIDHSLYEFNISPYTFQLFRYKFQFSKFSFIVIAIKSYTILQNQHEFESLKPCDH